MPSGLIRKWPASSAKALLSKAEGSVALGSVSGAFGWCLPEMPVSLPLEPAYSCLLGYCALRVDYSIYKYSEFVYGQKLLTSMKHSMAIGTHER